MWQHLLFILVSSGSHADLNQYEIPELLHLLKHYYLPRPFSPPIRELHCAPSPVLEPRQKRCAAVEKFASQGIGEVIAITNGRDAPLSKMGKVNLVIPTGFDHSVAQTRSFASMYLASVGLACIASHRENLLASLKNLVPVGEKIIREL